MPGKVIAPVADAALAEGAYVWPVSRTSRRVAFHALFAVVLTWPLVQYIDTGLPNGTEVPGTVAFFNLWTLRWDQQSLGSFLRGYWDAPIFHPVAGAFALSEPQPLTGLVFAPISWITHSPVLAYNVVLLVAIALNGLAAARLCRRLGVAPWPAALAGVIAQALPFVTNELGVLQLVMVFPTLFLVDAILEWTMDHPDRRAARWRPALAMGAWLAATFLTCGYYGLFTVVVIAPAALTLVRPWLFTRRRLAELGAAVVLAGVLCGPFLYGQSRYTSGYSRADSTILANSAPPAAWTRLAAELPGSTYTPWLTHEAGERLYPGTALLGLALAGALILVVREADAPRLRGTLVFLAVGISLGILVSLGLHLRVFDRQPYELVRHYVPGFADLRSPFRAGVLAQLLLVPLAGLGIDALWRLGSHPPAAAAPAALDRAEGEPAVGARQPEAVLVGAGEGGGLSTPDPRGEPEPQGQDQEPGAVGGEPQPPAPAVPAPPPGWRRWLGPVLAVAIVAVGMAEVTPLPQPMVDVPTVGAGTDWVDWLAAHHEPRTGDDSVAMVPFPATGNYTDYEQTTGWMLAALDHGHPLVNGYSGLFPSDYNALESAMRKGFPTTATFDLLARSGVSWVVVDRAWLAAAGVSEVPPTPVLRPVFQGETAIVYEFDPNAR
jgi:hypothetical protein